MNRRLGLALILLLLAPASFAEVTPNLTALIQETQKQSAEDNKLTIVWWMPEAFWKASFSSGSGITEEAAAEILEVLEPYFILAVVDGTIGPLGGAEFRPDAEVRAAIIVTDQTGANYKPLPWADVSPDVQNLIQAMKPAIENMIGEVGKNMHFYLFPAKNKDGEFFVNAAAEGSFEVSLGETSYTWRLPLSSVMPPKICPVDQESLSGAWKYCPWHGKPLKEMAEEKPSEPSPKEAPEEM